MISSNNQNQKRVEKPVTLVGNWQEQGVQHGSSSAEKIVPKDKLSDQFITTHKVTFNEAAKTEVPTQRNALKLFADQHGIGVDTVYDIKSKMNNDSGSITSQVQFKDYNPFEKTSDYEKVYYDQYGNEHTSKRQMAPDGVDPNTKAGQSQDQLYKTTTMEKPEGNFKYKKLLGDNMMPETDNETSVPLGRGYYFKDRKEDHKVKRSPITIAQTNNDLQTFLRK